jgi:hypothetical protein
MKSTKVAEILSTCEESLKRAASDALSLGHYDEATQIVQIAREVAALAGRTPKADVNQDVGGVVNAVESFGREAAESDSTPQLDAMLAVKKRRKYPQFGRQANDLVKIGWSKRSRKEYQHRAPRRILELLCTRLEQVGARKKIFTTESLFPLSDSEGNEIPSYQSYLSLAWLRQHRLVVSKGRSEYRLPNPGSLQSSADKLWNQLSEL